MLRISRLSDYATLVMMCLSDPQHDGLSARQIAERASLGHATVSKLLKLLSNKALILSKRGIKGGYQLAKPATEITLVDIITAIEGEPALTECSLSPGHCHHENTCQLRSNWQLINRSILLALNKISLDEMATPLTKHSLIRDGLPLSFYPKQASLKLATTGTTATIPAPNLKDPV